MIDLSIIIITKSQGQSVTFCAAARDVRSSTASADNAKLALDLIGLAQKMESIATNDPSPQAEHLPKKQATSAWPSAVYPKDTPPILQSAAAPSSGMASPPKVGVVSVSKQGHALVALELPHSRDPPDAFDALIDVMEDTSDAFDALINELEDPGDSFGALIDGMKDPAGGDAWPSFSDE